MTAKIISTYIAGGYSLNSKYNQLTITAAGGIGGTGLLVGSYAQIFNDGVVHGHGGSDGMDLNAGGLVRNGATDVTGALIEGYNGIVVEGGTGSVTNFGTIEGFNSSGARLANGGVVINGSADDTTALIEGHNPVVVYGRGSVTNFGVIEGFAGSSGVFLENGGTVINGSEADRTAVIDGGLFLNDAALESSAVVNSGAIMGYPQAGSAIVALGAAMLTNGSVSNAAARIDAYYIGLQINGNAKVTNFGTIRATAAGAYAEGVYLGGGGSLTNGSAGHQAALIEGVYGVNVRGAVTTTVTNFGSMEGSRYAVKFTAPADVLVVEAGCAFAGAIDGGGGTLVLANGVGMLTGLAGGNVTVSGSMPTTTFTDFGTMEVGSFAAFTLTGDGDIGAGQLLLLKSGLDFSGTLTIAGSLTLMGGLGGAGTLAITGGTALFGATASLSASKVTLSGATTKVTVATNLGYSGLWTQTAGTVSVASGHILDFTGAGDSFAGAFGGAGTIDFAGGGDTLNGVRLTAARVLINGASVTLAGTIVNTTKLTAATSNLIVSASGATLAGHGMLVFTDSASNTLRGATSAATLTNIDNTLSGAGDLGGGAMILINQANGVITGNGAHILVIDTGAATITNAGLIQARGRGGVTIQSAVANGGTLEAHGGNLTVNGAVSGSGRGVINGGTLAFASSFTETVAFGATGVLRLARSRAYTGSITGFSKTGATSLDLTDIAFKSAGEATFAGTATSGVLTVTDGTHVATIKLIGDYLGSTFVAASDGHGGVIVHDPAKAAAAPSPHPLIAAMASLGAGRSGSVHSLGETRPTIPHILAAGRGAFA